MPFRKKDPEIPKKHKISLLQRLRRQGKSKEETATGRNDREPPTTSVPPSQLHGHDHRSTMRSNLPTSPPPAPAIVQSRSLERPFDRLIPLSQLQEAVHGSTLRSEVPTSSPAPAIVQSPSVKPAVSQQHPLHVATSPRSSILTQTRKCYCRHGSKNSLLSTFQPAKSSSSKGPTCLYCGRCQECASWSIRGSFSRCKICQTKSPLLSLPLELQEEIYSYLELSSKWLLRLSCQYFHNTLYTPTAPMTESEIHSFYRLLRGFIPWQLKYCKQCVRYHPWTSSDYYTWKPSEYAPPQIFCLRDLDRTDRHPPTQEIFLDIYKYVCRHCLYVRPNRKCQTCFKCEVCANVKYQGSCVECIACDAGKARCTLCKRLRPPHRACRGCRKCEKCAGCLFQFGDTHCTECGGRPNSMTPKTRRALVESGPGYELYYHNPTGASENKDRRIGIR